MTTKEFIEKLAQDEALGKKLAACKAPEEAYAAAKEVGLTDDFEAFTDGMRELYRHVKSELSEDELEQIAGGLSDAGAFGVGAGIGAAIFASVAAA